MVFKPFSVHTINYPLKETETAWAHTIRVTMIPLPLLGVNDPVNAEAGRLRQELFLHYEG